ncbi:MAG TPA: hypothetical protein VGI75_06895 [Pirellulales bacterium]
MAAVTGWNAFWLSWLARPKGDRNLFRLIRQRKPRKMMLLGLGNLTRAVRMISLAQRYQQADYIHFAGIDRFDTRPIGGPRLSLKDAHVRLRATRSLINLIPGQPRETLMRAANALYGIELIVVSADQDAESMAQSWFYLQRVLAPGAAVLQEEIANDQPLLRMLSHDELTRLAAASAPQRRRAA